MSRQAVLKEEHEDEILITFTNMAALYADICF